MACTAPSVTFKSYAYLDPVSNASGLATPDERSGFIRNRRRRHSFHTNRRLSCDHDADAIFLRVSYMYTSAYRKGENSFELASLICSSFFRCFLGRIIPRRNGAAVTMAGGVSTITYDPYRCKTKTRICHSSFRAGFLLPCFRRADGRRQAKSKNPGRDAGGTL